jgi:uncharacterized protein YkwD
MARKAVAPALLALLVAIGLQLGAVAQATAPACPDTDVPAAQLTLDRFDASVFCLVNRRRAEYDRGRLSPNHLLHRAALSYSDSLLRGRFFSHHGNFGGRRTGSTVIGRLREMGYIRRGYLWSVGENLHWTTAELSTPADVVRAWMDSAIHRKYLLNPNFEELGVAAERGIPYDPSQTTGITVASEFGVRRPR